MVFVEAIGIGIVCCGSLALTQPVPFTPRQRGVFRGKSSLCDAPLLLHTAQAGSVWAHFTHLKNIHTGVNWVFRRFDIKEL